MKEPEPIPKDLGIKIGSEYEGFLDSVLKNMQQDTKNHELAAKMNKRLAKTLKTMINEERASFK